MARVSFSFNCGCGFRTADLQDAVRHSDFRSHSLTVLGEVVKNQDRLMTRREEEHGLGQSEEKDKALVLLRGTS